MEIGKRIRELREERGLTQREVARRAGLTPSGVGFIEHGQTRKPSVETVMAIARALGVPVEELLEEPALAGKAEAPKTGRLPEWASTSDIEVLGRNTSEVSSEELRRVLMQLARDLPWSRTLEGLRNESRSEGIARVLTHARIDAILEELRQRGEQPPEESLIAYRKMLEALTPLTDAGSNPDAERGMPEAG